MQVFLILFSIYFAHNQPLILNPYIELTLFIIGIESRRKGQSRETPAAECQTQATGGLDKRHPLPPLR